MDKLWKAVEREIMRRIGGKRIPITGRQRGDVPDGEHEWISVEIKTRKVIPKWIRNGMHQAQASNVMGNKLPIVFIHEQGTRYDDDLVVMRMKDFEDWYL